MLCLLLTYVVYFKTSVAKITDVTDTKRVFCFLFLGNHLQSIVGMSVFFFVFFFQQCEDTISPQKRTEEVDGNQSGMICVKERWRESKESEEVCVWFPVWVSVYLVYINWEASAHRELIKGSFILYFTTSL